CLKVRERLALVGGRANTGGPRWTGSRSEWQGFCGHVKAKQGLDLVIHRLAQALVKGLQTFEIPLESGDGVGDLEELTRQLVAGRLIAGERTVRSMLHGACQELCVAQCVADAVSGDGILEITGVADQRPPRTVALAHE